MNGLQCTVCDAGVNHSCTATRHQSQDSQLGEDRLLNEGLNPPPPWSLGSFSVNLSLCLSYYWFTVCRWALGVGQRSLCARSGQSGHLRSEAAKLSRASERYRPTCRIWRGKITMWLDVLRCLARRPSRNVYRTLEIPNLVFTTGGRPPERGVYSGFDWAVQHCRANFSRCTWTDKKRVCLFKWERSWSTWKNLLK